MTANSSAVFSPTQSHTQPCWIISNHCRVDVVSCDGHEQCKWNCNQVICLLMNRKISKQRSSKNNNKTFNESWCCMDCQIHDLEMSGSCLLLICNDQVKWVNRNSIYCNKDSHSYIHHTKHQHLSSLHKPVSKRRTVPNAETNCSMLSLSISCTFLSCTLFTFLQKHPQIFSSKTRNAALLLLNLVFPVLRFTISIIHGNLRYAYSDNTVFWNIHKLP